MHAAHVAGAGGRHEDATFAVGFVAEVRVVGTAVGLAVVVVVLGRHAIGVEDMVALQHFHVEADENVVHVDGVAAE